MESGSDGFNEPRSGENTEKNEERGAESEKGRDGAGGLRRFFLVAPSKKVGVDRNERSGEHAFTEKVLQEVWDAEGGFEDVGGVRIAEVVGEDTVANESGHAAEKDACGDEEGEAFGTGGLGWGGSGIGHEVVPN